MKIYLFLIACERNNVDIVKHFIDEKLIDKSDALNGLECAKRFKSHQVIELILTKLIEFENEITLKTFN